MPAAALVEGSPVVSLDGFGLTERDVLRVAREGARVELSVDALKRMEASREHVERAAASGNPVYGISTGFGALATTTIPASQQQELQLSLIRSHAAGMGPSLAAEFVRVTMLLRARTLAMGYSGVRAKVVESLLGMLNAGITPVVPRYGSVGCSGDLAPLAHIALALLGEGAVTDRAGASHPAQEALKLAGIAPVRPEAKEGLALVNGTDGMLGILILACADADRLFRTADIAAAMSTEALLGSDQPFRAALQQLRPHAGQRASAANLMALLEGSEIVASHRDSLHAVQDSYSVRCSPQVAGAARDTLGFARGVASVELASAVDNPAVLDDGTVASNGNFHGEPLAFAADYLAIAAAEVGAIAERRVDRMLDPQRSGGLPAFLADNPGVHSGLMVAQYTAAALVAENRRLAAPASVDSLPTSGMQEDHVSMGWAAALKLHDVLANLERVLAIELVVAARALDLRRPLHPAAATRAVRDLLRTSVPGPGPDRPLAPELTAAERLVHAGAPIAAVEPFTGRLQ